MDLDYGMVKLDNEVRTEALSFVRKAMSVGESFESEEAAFEFIERLLLDSELTKDLNFREKDNLIRQVYF